MMESLQNALYQISNALLVPTLVALLGLGAWTLWLSGGAIREVFSRGSVRRTFARARKDLPGALGHLKTCPHGLPARFAMLDAAYPGQRDKVVEDLEMTVAASLSKLTWITRIAPMLGLMCTLIPLGPALTGLASGDMRLLSGNLVVAFTATVIGVLIGCMAYTVNTVRRNWYDRDMSDLEHVLAPQASETQP
ncbi:MotA/TolQ/ExbB proton channel family protein [Haloferula sp. BvORR071]|uniref:MotA/TolQ/ExbB proton channel family protein n=1 Tax=Haloferula sp. BvORR071 TaxID=1396141 RepID=UPI000555D4D1|nr:MotA/TolQ/ExbB proton channel family protein [Haloferula sp. BvORR071]